MRKVARTLGVSAERVKEIERLVEEHSKANGDGGVLNRRSVYKRESARPLNGRRH